MAVVFHWADLDRVIAELEGFGVRLDRGLDPALQAMAESGAQLARERGEETSKLAAHASESVQAVAWRGMASVTLGNAEHPEAIGSEFGAHHDVMRPGRGKRGPYLGENQFVEWRGRHGLWFFPGIAAGIEEEEEAFTEAFVDLIAEGWTRA